jgi:hypothetical protein
MYDEGTRARDRGDRISARSRARRREHTEIQAAVERNSESARRLIESDELLTSTELERAKTQLEIAREEKQLDDWHKAELAQYKAENWTHNARARIVIASHVILGTASVIVLILGIKTGVSPLEAWHYLTSTR